MGEMLSAYSRHGRVSECRVGALAMAPAEGQLPWEHPKQSLWGNPKIDTAPAVPWFVRETSVTASQPVGLSGGSRPLALGWVSPTVTWR